MRTPKSQKIRIWKFYAADGSIKVNPSNSLYPFRAMEIGDWFVIDKADCVPANVVAMACAMGKAMKATFEARTRISDGREYLKVTRVPLKHQKPTKQPSPRRDDPLTRIQALKPGESLTLARGTYDAIEIMRALRTTLIDVTMTRHYGVATLTRAK